MESNKIQYNYILWIFIILCGCARLANLRWIFPYPDDWKAGIALVRGARDMIRETYLKMRRLEFTRLIAKKHVAWEIGFIIFELQDKYRKLIDKYNSSVYMDRRYFLMEHVIMLVEMEYHYWEIDHYSKLLHQIEVKYKTPLPVPGENATFAEATTTPMTEDTPDPIVFTKDLNSKPTTVPTKFKYKYNDWWKRWTSTKSRSTSGQDRETIGNYGWDPAIPL